MDEAGNNPRNLTNSPKADSSPSWSPDKQQIVFARSSRAQDGILDKKAVAASDIYLISASEPASINQSPSDTVPLHGHQTVGRSLLSLIGMVKK